MAANNTTEETKDEQKTSGEKQTTETEDLFHRFYLFGLGVRKDIEEAVSKLIEKGKEEHVEQEKVVDEVYEKAKEKTGIIEKKLEEFVNKTLESMNLVTKDKYDALVKRVEALEERMQEYHPE